MSHIPFSGSILCDKRIWTVLWEIDLEEAHRVRAAGCQHCGCRLHSATYPRKPHGLASSLRAGVRRFSFCCVVCRRRTTSRSVRFFGRRFRVASVFLMLCVRLLSGSASLEVASRQWGIPVSTLRRRRRCRPPPRSQRSESDQAAPIRRQGLERAAAAAKTVNIKTDTRHRSTTRRSTTID